MEIQYVLTTAYAAIHFHDTITLGSSIVGLLLLVAALTVFFYGLRYKNLYEIERLAAAYGVPRHLYGGKG